MKLKEWKLNIVIVEEGVGNLLRVYFSSICVCASSCLGCANGKRGNNTLRIGIYISGMFTNIVARWPGSTCVHRHAPCQLLHLNFKNMSVFN